MAKKTSGKGTVRAKDTPTVEIRQRKGSKGVMVGANTELYLDGKKIPNATKVSFEVAARGLAKVTIEIIGNVTISGKIGRFETVAASLQSIVEN